MRTLLFLSIVLTAVAMTAGFAHLFALPNKIGLAADEYLTVQQIYRGWALLGIVIVAALVSALVLAVRLRHDGAPFHLSVAALVCIALSLVVFFTFTFPVNQATVNWTELPDDWEGLRRQWEYSHAVGALFYLAALSCLALAAIHTLPPQPEERASRATPRSLQQHRRMELPQSWPSRAMRAPTAAALFGFGDGVPFPDTLRATKRLQSPCLLHLRDGTLRATTRRKAVTTRGREQPTWISFGRT